MEWNVDQIEWHDVMTRNGKGCFGNLKCNLFRDKSLGKTKIYITG